MKDTQKKSLSETFLNIALGFPINFGINVLVFPHFGIPVDYLNYVIIGIIYTPGAILQVYPIRRIMLMIWKQKQPVKGSIAETATSLSFGYLVNFISGVIVLPLFGMPPIISSFGIISAINTSTTGIRRFLLRRLFNHYGARENLSSLTLRFIKWLRK